jgi:hypothetical protein
MRTVVLVLAIACGFPAFAQTQDTPELTPDQKGYIAYDQCMLHAAIRASHTDAKDAEIFGIAKMQCAPTRSAVTKGLETNREYLAALDAADADKQANFPSWIKGVRERRRQREAALPASKPTSAN